ncbi:MAG: FadD3 family acyl-CoA ligase [Acidimicrobiales bacterium]|nr:FadD3 family acyl-CoA ligase [Acidimicrobiales bacterium]
MRGDLEWGTIPRMLAESVERHGDREALVDGELRLTYRELGDRVDMAAKAFLAEGLEVGDRVAIWAPNIHQWMVAALGALSAGGAIVPLNTRYKGEEAAYILAKSRSSVLCTVNGFLGTDYVAQLRAAMGAAADDRPVEGLPELRRIVLLSGDPVADTTPWDAFLGQGDGVTDERLAERQAEIGPDSLSDILFTAGTTGKPKGAMLTHGSTLRQFADWTEIIGLGADDRYLIVNPFFHVFGLKAGFTSALMRGATVVPMATFDIDEALAIVERERITMFPGPPTIHQAVLNHPRRDEFDLSSLRLSTTGAADVPEEMIRRMREELSYEVVVTGYGLTECTGAATMSRHDDPIPKIALTSGRPLPGLEVQIVDDDLNELPRGTQGEIVIRGYGIMLGYFDEPEQTATAIDPSGWLRSGDLGVMDDEDYVSITGRKKDMFIVGGFNTYPAEVEGVLLTHEAIAEVAVVGAPDERLGEVGMAWVILRKGAAVEPEELIDYARERLANYKVPRYVEFVDEFPVSAAGKVLKRDLVERAAELLADRA